MNYWAPAIEWLRRPFAALPLATLLLALLLSDGLSEWAGLGGFRPFIGVVFLICLAVLLHHLLTASRAVVGGWREDRLLRKHYIKRLNQLTDDEKLVLKRYIDGRTRAQNLDRLSGVVCRLEDIGVIYRASGTGFTYGGALIFPYIITDFAWDYLNKNPGILALRDNQRRREEEVE